MAKYNELKQALLKRAEAKNSFIEISNDKKSSKRNILAFYKRYRKADDNLIDVYEKYQKKGGMTYDKAS